MQLKNTPRVKALSLIIMLALTMCSVCMAFGSGLQLTATSEYTKFVQTYMNSGVLGNWTLVQKPIFPVLLNSSQVAIGKNWTIVCPLVEGHNYHVYCYGAWVNTSSAAKTDYDIYVYDPQGNLESSHTEAAGLPEHLGTQTNDALFTPAKTGNYSFVLKNDPRESQGSQQATFMIIENLNCDQWYTCHIDGKDGSSQSQFHTCWSYEFLTNQSHVELYINVPSGLDMYEARLYLMNNAKSLSINSYPLPWEAGLYGNVSSGVGGYNFENEAYRGVAYASCEYPGQAMTLSYRSNGTGASLYQLVLIGEEGTGDIQLMLKSQFGNYTLTPLTSPRRVCPANVTEIAYATSNASLSSAQLTYTTDNWTSIASVDMVVSDNTCNATIPQQRAGSFVQYKVFATDVLKNNMTATGNFTVKEPLSLSIDAVKNSIRLGENITIEGTLSSNVNDSLVFVQFNFSNQSQTLNCTAMDNGTFRAMYKPTSSGNWSVSANVPETGLSWRCDSQPLTVQVNEPPLYVKYGLYVVIGMIAASAAGGAVWYFRFRGR
jgi:hypothetical protein